MKGFSSVSSLLFAALLLTLPSIVFAQPTLIEHSLDVPDIIDTKKLGTSSDLPVASTDHIICATLPGLIVKCAIAKDPLTTNQREIFLDGVHGQKVDAVTAAGLMKNAWGAASFSGNEIRLSNNSLEGFKGALLNRKRKNIIGELATFNLPVQHTVGHMEILGSKPSKVLSRVAGVLGSVSDDTQHFVLYQLEAHELIYVKRTANKVEYKTSHNAQRLDDAIATVTAVDPLVERFLVSRGR